MKRSGPIKRKRSSPRRGPWHSAEYRAWCRDNFGCTVCRQELYQGEICRGREFAHGPVNGMSSKGGDMEGIILGTRHHRLMHQIGWSRFEKKYHFSRATEAARMFSA